MAKCASLALLVACAGRLAGRGTSGLAALVEYDLPLLHGPFAGEREPGQPEERREEQRLVQQVAPLVRTGEVILRQDLRNPTQKFCEFHKE